MTGFTWGPPDPATWGPPESATWGVGPPSPPEQLTATATSTSEIDLSWSLIGAPDGVVVYRARSSSPDLADYSPIATLGAVESFTDTDRVNGRTYHYRVASVNTVSESEPSNSDNATTALPDPALSTDTSTAREVGLTVTLADDNDEGEVLVSRGETTVATLTDLDDLTATDTGLLDGEPYTYTAERDTGDATATITEDIVTYLPDEDVPTLGNGVEDEVAVDRGTAATNNGDVRIQIRETGSESWDSAAEGYSEFIGAYDTLTTEFVGREDGEEYEVRARTETAQRTGAWTEPVAITTKFPGPSGLSASRTGVREITLNWTDNSDNESGQLIVREERFQSGWGDEFIIDDAGQNSESFTDSTVLPGRDYRYRIRAYTEHTEADSNTDTAATNESDLPTGSVNSDSWFARVTEDDRTFVPTITDAVEWVPKLNELPEVVIPIENAERYDRERFDGADIEVWKDGQRLPIDEIVEVDVEAGGAGDLTARGGKQLKRLVSPEYESEPVTDAAETLIQSNTDYTANVDAVDSSVSDEVLQQRVQDTPEWSNALLNPPDDQSNYEVRDTGTLALRQSTYLRAIVNEDTTGGQQIFEPNDSSDYIDGRIWEWTDGPGANQQNQASYTFDLDYEIPVENLYVNLRLMMPKDDGDGGAVNPGATITVDGVDYGGWPADSFLVDTEPDWFSLQTTGESTVGPGDVTVTVDIDEQSSIEPGGGEMRLNAIAVYDDRTNPSFGGVNSDRLAEVDLYSAFTTVETETVETVEQVSGARVLSTTNDPTSLGVGISNDAGGSYSVGSGDDVDVDFGSLGNELRVRFTLDGLQGESNASNNKPVVTGAVTPTTVDEFDLLADLDNTPFLVNRSFNGDLRDVLTEIAEFGGFIWEVRRDGASYSVEFTRPGTREATLPAGVETDFSIERDSSQIIQAAEITGGASPRNGERFTPLSTGTPIDLSRSRIIDGSEQVYDPDTGTVYEYGTDYTTNNEAGEIIVLSSGSMSTSTEYLIDYTFKPFGTYESNAYEGDTTNKVVRTLPSVTSEVAARSAALRLVSSNSTPRTTATLTLNEVGPELSLVESLSPATDAFRGRAFEIREADTSPSRAVLRLAAGETIEESIANLRKRLNPVEERV